MDFGDAFKTYERAMIIISVIAGVCLAIAGFAIWNLIADHVAVH
jgi:hypothetical protein